VRKMASENEVVRSHAFWVAAGVGDPELRSVLETGLGDSAEEVRLAARWGLARISRGFSGESATASAALSGKVPRSDGSSGEPAE